MAIGLVKSPVGTNSTLGGFPFLVESIKVKVGHFILLSQLDERFEVERLIDRTRNCPSLERTGRWSYTGCGSCSTPSWGLTSVDLLGKKGEKEAGSSRSL